MYNVQYVYVCNGLINYPVPNKYCQLHIMQKIFFFWSLHFTSQGISCVLLKKQLPDLADSETGDDTDAFFSFFPVPWPLFPPLCFGDPLGFLGESLMLDCSGNS